MIRRIRTAAMMLALLAPATALAQDTLDVLLERGFVAHWLVCGPFTADVDGGIANAAARGARPLGDRDYMTPLGGMTRLRPRHLLEVKAEEGRALWQQAGASDPTLDLAPFFPDAAEGVAFAAFYAASDKERNVLLEIHSPLGVRVWMNGMRLRDAPAAPVQASGVDRFILKFGAGTNLVVLEVPGVAHSALAEALGMGAAELRAGMLKNRTLLHGESGFEIAARLSSVVAVGDMAVVSALRDTGGFSGPPGDVRQEAAVALFNPSGAPSVPARIRAVGQGGPAVTADVPPLAADELREVTLPIAVGKASDGDAVNVTVEVEAGGATAKFTAPIMVKSPGEQGKVFVVAGREAAAPSPEDLAAEAERHLSAYERQAALLGAEPDYGFDLGEAGRWEGALIAFPETRKAVGDAVAAGRCAVRAGFEPLDERLVGAETLQRNLVSGAAAASAALNAGTAVYYAWGAPAIAAQTPQLLRRLEVPGIVSNLDEPGLPFLFAHVAQDGEAVPHRHKRTAQAPASIEELRRMAALQRREATALGLAEDMLVLESAAPPPEPFYLNNTAALREAFPSILVRAAGPAEFFEGLGEGDRAGLPVAGRRMSSLRPGELLVFPALKAAYTETEQRVLSAEAAATVASLLGLAYPDAELDHAWRQLYHWGRPDRLGFAARGTIHADMLAGLRDAADTADAAARRALAHIAAEADTLGHAPSPVNQMRALVVFNPSARTRSAPCELMVGKLGDSGLELVDEAGRPTPFVLERPVREGAPASEGRLRFLAPEVPGLGYRTLFMKPQGKAALPSRRPDAQIENDYWLLVADPATGAIRSLIDKRTGDECANGLLNHVSLLHEDTAKTRGGRECWTTGERDYAGSTPKKVQAVVVDGMQELVVESAFAGGTLTRRVRLYRGVPRIEFETEFVDAAFEPGLLAVLFSGGPQGCVPVFGERYGALVGRFGRGELDLRTSGLDNPSGTGAQPACQWFGLGPGDAIQTTPETGVPLQPALVVYGADPALAAGARMLVHALAQRGIPASMTPDTPPARDGLWTDSTEWLSLNDDLQHGTAMRIIVGGPGENTQAARLVEKLDAEKRAGVLERFEQGAAVFCIDRDVPPDLPAVPTLIFGGVTPSHAGNMAGECADTLLKRGVFGLPPDAYLEGEAPALGGHGMAVLFAGSRLCVVEADGTLMLGLEHPAVADAEEDYVSRPKHRLFRYALLPFTGLWRDAAIGAEAEDYNRPFLAVESDIHAGRQPDRLGCCAVKEGAFVVTAFKPAGLVASAYASRPVRAADGLLLRGYDALGRPHDATFLFGMPMQRVAKADAFELPGDYIEASEVSLVAPVGAGAVESFWMLPSGLMRGRGEEAAANPAAAMPAVDSAYWRYNAGVPSLGAARLSLVLRGDLSTGKAVLAVSNPSSDQAAKGIVHLDGPEGWSVAPLQFAYELAPGASAESEILILRDAAAQEGAGGLIAWTELEGTRYRAALMESDAFLEATPERTENQVRVRVRNRSAVPAEGFVELAATAPYWPALAGNARPVADPLRNPLVIGPYQEQSVLFRCAAETAEAGAAVRICANGRVIYVQVP